MKLWKRIDSNNSQQVRGYHITLSLANPSSRSLPYVYCFIPRRGSLPLSHTIYLYLPPSAPPPLPPLHLPQLDFEEFASHMLDDRRLEELQRKREAKELKAWEKKERERLQQVGEYDRTFYRFIQYMTK